jgi:hypothetical protein
MVPALVPGIVVVGIRPRRIRPGDVVVVHHDGLDKVKRVKDVQFNKVYVIGDNRMHSTDSHDFGWLSTELIIAKVVWPRRLKPGAI